MIPELIKRERTLFMLSVSALALAAIASTMYFARIDLTASRENTLSKATRQLHRELAEPVRITYFVSRNLADRHPGPAAIEDLLREVESANAGRVRVRIVDPEKNPEEPEAFGLVPQQMQVVERSEQRLALVYTGIVVEYLDRYETIPAILSTETLEYELVKAIRAAAGGTRTIVGLLVGDDDKTLAEDYQTLYGSLARAGYEVREIRRGETVDDDVDLLFILGNTAIDRYDTAFIDAFVMRGGSTFFAVKAVDVRPEQGLAAKELPEGGVLALLSAYGFSVSRQLVLDQSNLTVPFQMASPTGGYRIQYIRYPHWVAVDARYTDAESPLTSRFAGLDLYWPSPIDIQPAQGVMYRELAKTTTQAWLQAEHFAASPSDQALFSVERDETLGQYLLAASATGIFTSAFNATDMPSREGAAPPPAPQSVVSAATRMVVVSSGDFLTDLMRMSESTFNATFAVTAADWLTSSDDLVAIRSRTAADDRLNKVRDEGLKDLLITLTYIVTLILVPLGVIAYGFVRAARRNRVERECRAGKGVEA
ncbi:MAG: GldG family protein [Spirochaetales bacterium]|nr:GldG family protein [Spirochaetales bacterium]